MIGGGPVTAGPAGSDINLARSTVYLSGLIAVSRVTGFVRFIVVGAVLGTTYLGNTYQSANTVPNLLFELFAAGALQAVLIPSLVELVDSGRKREAEHVAGSVLGLAGAAIAVVSVAGMIAAPWVMRFLVSGVEDPAVREAQVRLGSFFLLFFLPQTLLYTVGLVSTAVLNAQHRFALPIAAPIVNNVVVIGAYLVFHRMRAGAPPSLDLALSEKLVLAGGTTLAVVAFCLLPLMGAIRSGFSLRPRLDYRHPGVRRVASQGLWAALYLAMTQVLLAAVLLFANRVEGGVVAYQFGFTVFLLPHALFAVPVLTTLFPRLARSWQAGERDDYVRLLERGVRAIAFFALPATAALIALAPQVARIILFGEAAHSGAEVAGAIRGFAPGIVGYGLFLYLTRAYYAVGDARTPATVNTIACIGGVAAMAVAFTVTDHDIGALAAAHSGAYLAGAAVLFIGLARRTGRDRRPRLGADTWRAAAAAAVAGAAMAALASGAPGGRPGAAATIASVGAAGVAAYVAAQWLLAGRRLVLPELFSGERSGASGG